MLAVRVGDMRRVDGAAGGVIGQRLGQPEVEHLHAALVVDLDVGGLQIAMNDALFVRGLDGLGQFQCDTHAFFDRQGPAGQPLRQIRPRDQFHRQRVTITFGFQPVDTRDPVMVQRGQHLRLAPEAGQAFGILGHGVGQHLQRHVAVQFAVGGAEDLAHATGADFFGDAVMGE